MKSKGKRTQLAILHLAYLLRRISVNLIEEVPKSSQSLDHRRDLVVGLRLRGRKQQHEERGEEHNHQHNGLPAIASNDLVAYRRSLPLSLQLGDDTLVEMLY